MTQQQTPPDTPEEEGPVQLVTDADESDAYIPAEPTKDELTAATSVYTALKKGVAKYSDDQTVSALIALVDVHKAFSTPENWMAEEDDEYEESSVVANIAKYLLLGCRQLDLKPTSLVCLWRNKDKWMDGERTKRSASTKFNTRTQFLVEGKKAAIEINFHHWLTLNPLQKVQTIYHELRGRSGDGVAIAPDFVGFFSELEVFGARSFHEFIELGRSVALAETVEHPHQLDVFVDDEMVEA